MSQLPKVELITRSEIQLTPDLIAKIEKCVEDNLEQNLEKIVKRYIDEINIEKIIEEKINSSILEVNEDEEIELKMVSEAEGTKLIMDYLTKYPGARTSNIIIDLKVDDELVISILKKLKEKDILEVRDLE